MESITQFRHMMAEQKYFEVQKLVEAQLLLVASSRPELLKIYCEALEAQEKTVPTKILVELVEEEFKLKNFSESLKLIDSLSDFEKESNFLKLSLIRINVFEETGRTHDLYKELSSLLIQLFEKQIPFIPDVANRLIDKFFKDDFHLGVLKLSFALLVSNIPEAEKLTRELITSCMERSSAKGIKEKLNSISEILRPAQDLMPLKMYQNFCEVYVNGIKEKRDTKKIIEMVIYFDDFIFQAQVLNLLMKLNLKSEAKTYASVIKRNKDYNFIYFNKYLPDLKKLFIQEVPKNNDTKPERVFNFDLKVDDKFISDVVSPEFDIEKTEGEELLKTLIKYQDFSSKQLCDLAVGFIQSEMPEVALVAAKQAIKRAENSVEILKGSYLKLNTELMLQDFRAAQDTCLEALNLATTEDDILSFMYGQAEALIRLDDKSSARKVLKRILDIDQKYRLAKERLEKLNEI